MVLGDFKMGSLTNGRIGSGAGAKSRRAANLERCIICYKSEDVLSGAGIGVLMKSLVGVARKALGIKIDCGLAKGGLIIMCKRCHSEYQTLEKGALQRDCDVENSHEKINLKFLAKIAKSVKESDYLCNSKIGDPFDVFRYLAFKTWRRASSSNDDDKEQKDFCQVTIRPLDSLSERSPSESHGHSEPDSTERNSSANRLKDPNGDLVRPAAARKLIFVKRDPVTGEMVEVPRPTEKVIRGKLNGKEVTVRTDEGMNWVMNPKTVSRSQDSSKIPLNVSTFASSELKEYKDETESVKTLRNLIPHQLDGTDIFIDEDSSDGDSELVTPRNGSDSKSAASHPGTGNGSANGDYEEVRSQRSGRRINRRVYDASNWITGTRLDQMMRSEKGLKTSSPPKRAKTDMSPL